jgi:hypothetical protein
MIYSSQDHLGTRARDLDHPILARAENTDNSTRQKMPIMDTLKKFAKSIMECLYKFLYSNVTG